MLQSLSQLFHPIIKHGINIFFDDYALEKIICMLKKNTLFLWKKLDTQFTNPKRHILNLSKQSLVSYSNMPSINGIALAHTVSWQ